jgi:hypothetical protein
VQLQDQSFLQEVKADNKSMKNAEPKSILFMFFLVDIFVYIICNAKMAQKLPISVTQFLVSVT